MPDHHRDETPSTAPADEATTSGARTRHGTSEPRTPQQWRELLREEDLPEQLDELPYFQRRRARKAWRSARRDARAQWVKRERRNVPTPITVPIIALLLAGLVAAASWLWPGKDSDTVRTKPHSTLTTAPASPATTVPEQAPTPSATVELPDTPDGVAQAFVTAYCTRNPMQDTSHVDAVTRAAPYASDALIRNLKKHGDLDWNKLIAAQALTATPAKVTITTPAAKQKLPPDTSVRVYRQATTRIDVTGTEDYSYTRRLTVEVSRADIGQPWQVTRVLGIQE
ncbi:hypothetical protein ACGRHY_28985 [Streptomyces sp. HK10]|uniref:hypothetical protein n=1 Tax=Streptomyces sp. HK10 TaxID=3373255 RepID=UPI003747B521